MDARQRGGKGVREREVREQRIENVRDQVSEGARVLGC